MVTWGADAPAANIGETKATNRNTWRKTFPGKGITNTLLGPLRNRFKKDEYNSHRLIWSPCVGRAPPPAAFDFGSRGSWRNLEGINLQDRINCKSGGRGRPPYTSFSYHFRCVSALTSRPVHHLRRTRWLRQEHATGKAGRGVPCPRLVGSGDS